MSWPLCKIFAFLFLNIALAASSFANEKMPEKKTETKEVSKEAGKEEKKDSFGEVQGHVSTLQAKIKASEETIRKLIEEKQHTPNPDAVSEIIKNMVTEHKTMQKSIEEYDQARSYLQYRFPEKGLKGERQYERIEMKSLIEMESEMGLDSRIKRTLHKVRKQYKAPNPRVVHVESRTAEPTGKVDRNKKSSESPSISDPVMLTK